MKQELNYFVRGKVTFNLGYVEELRGLLKEKIVGRYEIDVLGDGDEAEGILTVDGYVGMVSEESLRELLEVYEKEVGDDVRGQYVIVPLKTKKALASVVFHREGNISDQKYIGDRDIK